MGWICYRWFSPPASDATSPEIAEIAKNRRPVVETPPAPPPVESGPRGRQLMFRNGELYEIAENGSIWLAGDDGRQEEDILVKWKRAREKEINFT